VSQEKFAKKISLRENEEVIAVIHHHPITYGKQIFITVFLILAAFFLMFFLFTLGYLGVALFLALLATGSFYGFREFYIWYCNVFIITNFRLIDFDQNGFFNKTVSETAYDKIIDICYTVKGFWQTVLKLGTIKVKSSGAKIVLANIHNVIEINQVLTDLIREHTGKNLEIKKEGAKEDQVTTAEAETEDLSQYEDYNLQELQEEFKETFGELELKGC